MFGRFFISERPHPPAPTGLHDDSFGHVANEDAVIAPFDDPLLPV
jgi:hypothetical protein